MNNFVKAKNLSMIQLNRIQLTSQTPSHVEITKILITSQRIKLTVTKYGFLYVYKLTIYLVSVAKSLPLQQNTPFHSI